MPLPIEILENNLTRLSTELEAYASSSLPASPPHPADAVGRLVEALPLAHSTPKGAFVAIAKSERLLSTRRVDDLKGLADDGRVSPE